MSELSVLRRRLGFTQKEMAEHLGVSMRAYQEQEASAEPRQLYVLGARHLVFERVGSTGDPDSDVDEREVRDVMRALDNATYDVERLTGSLAVMPFDLVERLLYPSSARRYAEGAVRAARAASDMALRMLTIADMAEVEETARAIAKIDAELGL